MSANITVEKLADGRVFAYISRCEKCGWSGAVIPDQARPCRFEDCPVLAAFGGNVSRETAGRAA